MSKKILKLSDKLNDSEQRRLEWIRDCLNDWLKMTDIQELVIIAREKTGAMRFQMPVRFTDDFWWIGALENLKSNLNNRLNEGAHDVESEEN